MAIIRRHRPSTPVANKYRRALRAAYNDRCQYCDASPAPHIDHIYPLSEGGKDELENLVPACGRCNLKKADLKLKPLYLGILHSRAAEKAEKVIELEKQGFSSYGEEPHRSLSDILSAVSENSCCLLSPEGRQQYQKPEKEQPVMTAKWSKSKFGGAYYLERPHPQNPKVLQRLAAVHKNNGVGYYVEDGQGVLVSSYEPDLVAAKKVAQSIGDAS